MAHGDWALAYNDAGRLVSAAHALTGVSLAYEYNALGQRVRKTVDDNGAVTETRFLYDLDGHLIAETDTAGALLREYLLLGDTPVGFVAQAQGASGRSLFFVHADHLDTARVITDASGQVAWQALREPFGATTVLAGNTLDWPLRFPGQYLDSETGWHYNYFRDYEPEVGRYLQSDPIGLWGGANSYGYVDASPVGHTDRYGLTKEGAAVGAAIGGAIAIGGSVVVDAATGGLNVLATPGEVAAGAAAGAALGDAISNMCATDDGECEKLYATDTSTCNGITRVRGARAGAVCHASASERYSACLVGRPIPPLNTWNN